MSGAEIANVCNEAALIAAREGAGSVGMSHLDRAVDRVLGGLEKKTRTQLQRERVTVAWHEAGHAVAGWFLPYADPVMKVSIVPRGRGSLGYSQSLPREIALYSEEHLEDMVRMALGGRAAEQLVLGEVSTGAQNDMERVTAIAQQCVSAFGFSEKIGHVSFAQQRGGDNESNELFKPYSEVRARARVARALRCWRRIAVDCARRALTRARAALGAAVHAPSPPQATAQVIDAEVRQRVAASYEAVLALLRDKRPQLDALAERLLLKEVVGVEDLVELLGPRKSVVGDSRYDEYLSKMIRPDEKASGAQPPPPSPSSPPSGEGAPAPA